MDPLSLPLPSSARGSIPTAGFLCLCELALWENGVLEAKARHSVCSLPLQRLLSVFTTYWVRKESSFFLNWKPVGLEVGF